MKECKSAKKLTSALEDLTEEIKGLRRDFRKYFGSWDDDYFNEVNR